MEKQQYLNVMTNYKRMASNLITEISCYDNWSDELCRKQTKELYAKLIKEFDKCDFLQFSVDELKQLDFKWWDEDLICFPPWVIDCLDDGVEVYSISDDISDESKSNVKIFDRNKKLDKDTRYGITAYGFNKSQLRDATIDKVLKD